MRAKLIIISILFLLFAILAAQNTITTELEIFFWHLSVPLIVLIVIIFIIGLVIGIIACSVYERRKKKIQPESPLLRVDHCGSCRGFYGLLDGTSCLLFRFLWGPFGRISVESRRGCRRSVPGSGGVHPICPYCRCIDRPLRPSEGDSLRHPDPLLGAAFVRPH